MIKMYFQVKQRKAWNENQWGLIKEKVKEKRARYYQNPQWLIRHSPDVDMKPSYLPEEVEQMCLNNNITLPESLHYYLTHISREIVCNSYQVVFTGEVDCSGDCNLSDDCKSILKDDVYDSDYEEEEPDEQNGFFKLPMAKIGEGGCAYSDYIVLRGNQFGTVWRSDEDRYIKTHETFLEYIQCNLFD